MVEEHNDLLAVADWFSIGTAPQAPAPPTLRFSFHCV